MKISDVHVVPSGPRGMTFVEVETDAGVSGIGATGSPPFMIAPIVGPGPGSLAEVLIGEDLRDVRRLWRAMFQGWQTQRGRGSEGGFVVNAMGAVDMALWDAAGKAYGVPLHRLLGGALVPRVMVYASATAYDPGSRGADDAERKSAEALAAEAASLARQGFKAIKYGWGANFELADEERLAAIRESIGPDVRLMLDIGCPAYWTPGWTAQDAIRACELLEDYDIYFVEEPMPPHDVEGHAAITEATSIRIASGESLSTFHDFQRFIEWRALDILQPDAQQMGITQMVDVARAAEQAGLLVVPHSPWSSQAVAAHVQILSTVANAPLVEYPAMESYGEDTPTRIITEMAHFEIVEQPPTFEDGYVLVSDQPGLGLGGYVHEAVARIEAVAREAARD